MKATGLSGGVRQIVRLTTLHRKIIDHLKGLKSEASLDNLSERQIRSIVSLPTDQQILAFEAKFTIQINP